MSQQRQHAAEMLAAREAADEVRQCASELACEAAVAMVSTRTSHHSRPATRPSCCVGEYVVLRAVHYGIPLFFYADRVLNRAV